MNSFFNSAQFLIKNNTIFFFFKVSQDNISTFLTEAVNDFHHSSRINEQPSNRVREKQKSDQDKPQECKKRVKGKWSHGEGKTREKHKTREETLSNISSQIKGGEKNLNQCIGEKDVAASLTCTSVEGGRVTPGSRSSDRFATKLNNNYNYKYYGFLDSGDENVNDISKSESAESNRLPGKKSAEPASQNRCRSRDDNLIVKNEGIECGRNKKSMASGKEIVYENLRIESSRVDKKLTKSDQGKCHGKNRSENKKANYEHLSKRFLEYNLKFGKFENKLNGFSAPETSFADLYGGENSFEDYKGLYDGFSYLESKYTYSVSGIPGNLAQSSAAAAFFAR